jgi:hypothetical protein
MPYIFSINFNIFPMRHLFVVAFYSICALFPPSKAFAQCQKGNCISGTGTYLYPSGARYEGEFRAGKANGQGSLFFSNGNRYTGAWVEQYREGKGILNYVNGDKYLGDFKRSKLAGQGSLIFATGGRYEGQFSEDQPNGKGIYIFSNKDRYEGDFKDGKMNGKGTLKKADGTTLAGNWLNDAFIADENIPATQKPINTIAATKPNSTAPVTSTNDTRNCNKENCLSGKGYFMYGDGSKYVGEFKNGDPEGEGVCEYKNGDKYVGTWKNHSPNGKGIMYYHYGKNVSAYWDFGKIRKSYDLAVTEVLQENIQPDRSSEVKIWAVVIGVARYQHMPVLKYTDDDAYQMFAFLKSPEGGALPDKQVKVLIDEEANRNNILRTMRQVFLKADENDVVMLYFSGHGLEGSFIPSDFDGFNNKLSHEDVKAIFKESKAKHKLCIADACHSGSMLAARTSYDPSLKKYYEALADTRGGTALLLSSKGEEFSLEDQGLRQGIFSHFTIRGLKGEADTDGNKVVTIRELYNYVFGKVKNYTAGAQNPMLTGDFDDSMPVGNIR